MASRGTSVGKKSDRPLATVKIPSDVLRWARIVAAYRDQTIASYLDGLLRDRVIKDLEAAQRAEPRPKG